MFNLQEVNRAKKTAQSLIDLNKREPNDILENAIKLLCERYGFKVVG